jgi:uncharacterized repeat protein (TIGR01451 family)
MIKKIILLSFVVVCLICSISMVSAHEGMENPIVTIENLTPGSEVSGNVNFQINVHEHNEAKYVNVTAENMESHKVYFNKQDSNRADGWSVSWDTSDAPNGEYWITAKAVDVKGLEGKSEMKLILNNIPKESHIILENTTTVVNKSTNIVATMLDANNTPISNKDLTFIVDGVNYGNVKTTSSGVASLPFTPREIKDYTVLVKFGGDNKFLLSQMESIIKVSSNVNATILTTQDITGNYKQKILLNANLVAPGFYTAIFNKKIEFYINGNLVGSALTNEKGDAQLEYIVNETSGTYLYTVKYQNENNTNFTDYASLYVPKSQLYMTMSAVTYSVDGIFTVGNQFKVTYTINNDGPDSAVNTIYRYNIPKSLKYVSSSTSKGKITVNSNELTWDIGELNIGNQNAEIIFQIESAGKSNLAGVLSTDTYDKSIDNAVPTRFITANSYRLKSNGLIKYFTGSEKYRVYLYNQEGNAISGANIKIAVNKQVLNLKTNMGGFVELAVNLKVGTYDVKITCNKMSLSNKIVIKPLIITKDLSKKKTKVIKFTAKVLNNKGKVVKNKKVTFKVKGKKYKVKTNKKGIATLSLKKLKKGKFVIYTSYGKSTVKNTIKIR